MYAVTAETPRPEQERHTHLVSYISNLATSEARHNSCTQLLWNHRDPGRQGTAVSAVTAENSLCGHARLTRLRSYRRNLKNVYACVL
jgi:hypothetical protein